VSIPLARIEEIIDASGIAPPIEALLPIGVRHRQLRVRTLLAGMLLSQAGQRPAHLTRVRDALLALPGPDQVRLGVIEDWKTGPHLLTYRQTERTSGLVDRAPEKETPDGTPPGTLTAICNDLLEALSSLKERAGVKGVSACGFAVDMDLQGMVNWPRGAPSPVGAISGERAALRSGTGPKARPRSQYRVVKGGY
jgi:hypothetical protein